MCLLRTEVVDLDLVVQDGLDGLLLLWYEIVGEDHLRHVVIEATNLEQSRQETPFSADNET